MDRTGVIHNAVLNRDGWALVEIPPPPKKKLPFSVSAKPH